MNQLQFDDVKNFDDWGVYLTSYDIGDAEPKEYYVDLPSGHGSLDLTEALTGEVSYGDRSFSAELTLAPPRDEWTDKLNTIRTFLNGKTRTLREPLDDEYYYIGRFRTSFKSDGVIGRLAVTGVLQPYKLKNHKTVRNFTIGSSGSVSGLLPNASKRVIPKITTSGTVELTYQTKTIVLNAGTHKVTNIVLEAGDNPITITGSQGTTIKFEYQEGAL